jgi:alkylation response protein AidB-like acyl-CoA dehydrogenase
MSQYNAPLNDMNFVLFDMLKVQDFWANSEQLSEAIEQETASAILEEAAKLTGQEIAPYSREADEIGVHIKDGTVITPEKYKDNFKMVAEGGWFGLSGSMEYGGMGMPKSLTAMYEEMLCSADLSFALYPSLSSGSAMSLVEHGSEELKETYLPKIYSGEWAGTMCLTESHAGSDLGLIKTKAIDNGDGTYDITGSKIFITGGDHDMAENIVHLVLAKLPDAPEGSRGISLFLVPKFMVNADGSLGERNPAQVASVEHKMGIHASATCVMNFDSAKGYLVGEVNKGLAAMFVMMNYERLFVGIQGLGAAERSYQNALAYAQDRGQGRGLPRRSEGACDPIIVHADVRRMLLNMKAMNEGARALSGYVAAELDKAKYSNDENEQLIANAKAQYLTPIVKAFMTDTALETTITGQQVFGGHGFIREWGQEQLVRDTRITQIYEGTNGIQAVDLVGRKLFADKGKTFHAIMEEIKGFANSNSQLAESAQLLAAVEKLETVTGQLMEKAQANPNELGAAACDYLHTTGYVMYAYLWAKMMVTVQQDSFENKQLADSKIKTGRYYFARMLPRVDSLISQVLSGVAPIDAFEDENF